MLRGGVSGVDFADIQICSFERRCENNAMALEFTTSYLKDSLALLRYYKGLAERAMAQLTDDQLLAVLDEQSNSIAVIVKHMVGNMRSRFTDFLISDGEKPDRRRDLEFTDPPQAREALLASWDSGWGCVFAALDPLDEDDLAKTVTIRGEAHSVMQAINRQSGALQLSLRPGCVSVEAPQPRWVEAAQRGSRPVRRIQSACAGGRGKPAIVRGRGLVQSQFSRSRTGTPT